MLKLLLRPLSFRDVAVYDDQIARLPFRVTDHTASGFEDPPSALLVAHLVLHAVALSCFTRLFGTPRHSRTIIRMDLSHRRRALQVFGRISEYTLIRGAVINPLAITINHRYQIGGVLADHPKQFVTRQQLPPH